MNFNKLFDRNSTYALCGLIVFLISMSVGIYIDKNHNGRTGIAIGFLGGAIAFLSTAIGPLVTGYSWRNLVAYNQGPKRTESPTHFWVSVLSSLVATGFCVWAALSVLTTE